MPSNTRRVRIKKEKKTTRRSWLDTVLQDPDSAATITRPSSSTSSNDPRSTLSTASPVSAVSESEADVVAFLTDAAIHRRQHFEAERKHRKLPTPTKRNDDDLQHRMRPCEVGPPPNFGTQNPLLKQEEELLSLHKRSLDDSKPSDNAAQWILPSPPPTARQHSLEDSEATHDGGRWLPISPPLTADKPTFATTTTCQRPRNDCPSTPPPLPTIAPAPPATSNLRAIAPKTKKQIPITIPRLGYEEIFKDTSRLTEEVKKRGKGHVEARRRGGEE
ncbi:MAG: hypothetical protein OHK93_008750 [Ramalina farinacea]|uniref:Uncharacterized protein n=1 Tax=Ramalina farinacea TaxID=258253 RepID=A0AA43QN12_9LECA|nr:hypothetical protein [Ramalina farinacea]